MQAVDTPISGSIRASDISVAPLSGPFSIADEAAYRSWREAKLAAHPRDASELSVDIADPLAPSPAELAAIAEACTRADMCVYRFVDAPADETHARRAVSALAAACGLTRFEKHRSAGPDGLVAIEVAKDAHRSGFIPYSTRPIGWHTDGYYAYEGPSRAIRAMVLHCVRPAAEGGVNALLDHEIAYIRLRDRDPAFVEALMRPNAMSIPPSVEEDGSVRDWAVGPVFEVDPATGGLLMRYTARKRHISWAEDSVTRAAVAALEEICATDPLVFRLRLDAGQGVVCNNVLHDRTGFGDETHSTRLLLRLRSYDRLFASPGLAAPAAE
ncbi:TauD/TfdA family dioxygenase [Pinisolibacter sp.]|uniref:TauD/TfdA family dioxygenase n=1 Tax=Pinisolibacter sp. TaxID=2172024 RepID=UPI002FDD0818